MNLKPSKNDNFDSNTSEGTVYIHKPNIPVTNITFSQTDVFLDSSSGLYENSGSTSAPPVSEIYLKAVDTRSTGQTSANAKKLISSSQILINKSISVQGPPPLPPIPLAPSNTPVSIP